MKVNRFMKKFKETNYLITVFTVLVIIGAALLTVNQSLLKQIFQPKVDQTPPPTIQEVEEIEEVVVEISSDGFLPQTIKIKSGTQVTFINTDKEKHRVVSDPHPSHSVLPELDTEDPLDNGESFSFIFENTGTYTYHDESNPLKNIGTILVE